MSVILVLIATAAAASAPEISDPWHEFVAKRATAILEPQSNDYPPKYGNITCNAAEDLIASPSRDTLIECWLNTSCGPSGTAFVFRKSENAESSPALAATLLFQEQTSGYMGGYYETADLDGDGFQEVLFVSGTDGVARSSLKVRRYHFGQWIELTDNTNCTAACQSHDYLLMKGSDSTAEIIAVRGCQLENGNGIDCEPSLHRIDISSGRLVASQVEVGKDQASVEHLSKIVKAVNDPLRKDPDRNDNTLQILKEILVRQGTSAPPLQPYK